MPGLIDVLTQTLGGNTNANISRQLGADPGATSNAIAMALPLLLSGLARNASTPDGADALHGAITRDHDGSILDDLSGFLGNAQAGPGAGILNHVLGGSQPVATQAIGRSSGLDAGQVTQLLTMLAPIVMGVIGRTQRQQGLDAGGLATALDTAQQQHAAAAPDLMGIATQLLDRNHDGSMLDEITRGLGGLFGKR